MRRLAPHCARIEIADLPSSRDEERLLYAMGFETANVHLGTPRIRETLRKQLAARRGHWLHEAAKLLSAEVVRDWRDWRDRLGRQGRKARQGRQGRIGSAD